jgi:hypothetical protein
MTKLIKPFTGDYPITQKFGEKITDSSGHSGIDYALPLGTPVLAAADGEVWKAGWDATGYGNCVMIKHPDGSGTVYGHLLNWSVYSGQKVKASEKIGNSGNTGNSTGAHLHFEYRTKYDNYKTAVNPAEYFTEAVPSESTFKGGWYEIVCDSGVNIRISPAGALKSWLPKGVRVKLTGETATASGLTWHKMDSGYWIAEFDSEGTKLIDEVKSV